MEKVSERVSEPAHNDIVCLDSVEREASLYVRRLRGCSYCREKFRASKMITTKEEWGLTPSKGPKPPPPPAQHLRLKIMGGTL